MNKSESKYFNTSVKMNKALLELLDKKDFEYITIREICNKANVNRSTFYLHYENTTDLLNESIRYLLDNFLSYFSDDKKAIVGKFDNCELSELIFISSEYLNPYLSYIKENRRVFSAVVKHSNAIGFNGIYERLFKYIFNPILDRFHFPKDNQKYVMKFYLNGIIAIVLEWLNNGCDKSIEDISGIIIECIFNRNDVL